MREWPIKDKTKAHHIEQFRATVRFFEALQFHFNRRKEAGKPLTVSGVCSYFSEVDKGAFFLEIETFREWYKGGTIAELKRTGTVWHIVIVRKTGNIKGRGRNVKRTRAAGSFCRLQQIDRTGGEALI